MNVFDTLIIVMLLIFGFSGYIKGFIISLFNFVGFILSIYLAKLYYPVVYKFIVKNTGFYAKVKTFVVTRVAKLFSSISSGESIENILESFKLPDPMREGVIKNSYEMTNSFQETMSNGFTSLIITLISFLIVFFAAKIILYILVSILDNIAKLPVLNTFNKLLGLGFGVLKGALIIYIIFAILTPFIAMNPNGFIAENTVNSTLANFFYTKNIIIKLWGQLTTV